MSEKIIDVHTIMPGTGWTVQEQGVPVACFALVTAYDDKYGFIEKKIIALNEHDIGMGLLGYEIDGRMLNIIKE